MIALSLHVRAIHARSARFARARFANATTWTWSCKTSRCDVAFDRCYRLRRCRLSVAGAGRAQARDSIERRWFADRPVAWHEHDDDDVAQPPAPSHLQDLDRSLLLRDSIANEIDRFLNARRADRQRTSTRSTRSLARPGRCAQSPPADGSGRDRGRAGGLPPRLPLRIVEGKDQGATAGFGFVTLTSRKFMLKFDPAGYVGLTTGAEMIGERLFHAAGFNVAGAFCSTSRRPTCCSMRRRRIASIASSRGRSPPRRPVTSRGCGSPAGRTLSHRCGALDSWTILGGYDTLGRRDDDPNDRIPHERRRSLRASWVLFAWLSELDPGSINSLDSYVEEGPAVRPPLRARLRRHARIGDDTTQGAAPDRRAHHRGRPHVAGVLLARVVPPPVSRRPRRMGTDDPPVPAAGWLLAERLRSGRLPDQSKDPPTFARRTAIFIGERSS